PLGGGFLDMSSAEDHAVGGLVFGPGHGRPFGGGDGVLGAGQGRRKAQRAEQQAHGAGGRSTSVHGAAFPRAPQGVQQPRPTAPHVADVLAQQAAYFVPQRRRPGSSRLRPALQVTQGSPRRLAQRPAVAVPGGAARAENSTGYRAET